MGDSIPSAALHKLLHENRKGHGVDQLVSLVWMEDLKTFFVIYDVDDAVHARSTKK
jgi:hypothetical protein